MFRIYITDGLKVISEAVAGGNRAYLQTRYVDILDPPPEDNRTADEIISNIKSKLRALGGDSDEPI